MTLQILIGLLGCSTEEPLTEAPPEPIVEPDIEPAIEAEIRNNQPHISLLEFTDRNYQYTDPISISYETFDPDGDSTREEVFWAINGQELIAAKGKTLRRSGLKKGDMVTATVVVTDGKQENQKSIQTTIQNAPPQWLRDPRTISQIDGYQVQATDPDGDPILYRLEGAPDGMSISEKGRISYTGSTEEKGGQYTVRVIAEDPEKANVQWSFSIVLSAGSASTLDASQK